jgi:hypothetical protein
MIMSLSTEGMSMNDHTTPCSQSDDELPAQSLQAGQAVAVGRGVLKGMRGVLVGFSRDHNCLIELDVAQRGVLLVVPPAAVKARRSGASDEGQSRRPAHI